MIEDLWHIICECTNQADYTPTIEEVMQQIADSEVCTGTQCFDSLDALVPMHHPPVGADSQWAFLILFFVSLMALFFRPSRDKAVKHFHPPPPPPPPSTAL